MRQTGYRPKPAASEPLPAIRFHGFKPRHIKRQIGQLYAELAYAREPLMRGFMLDAESYSNLLTMLMLRDAALPAYNTMSLPNYVDAFHNSDLSTLLTMIEPIVVFMAATYEPMDRLCLQMRRWGAFDDPFSLNEDEQRTRMRLWVRTRKLLNQKISPSDMPRRFISYYVANPDQVEDQIKLTAEDLLEIQRLDRMAEKLGFGETDYFPATVQLLRRTLRDEGLHNHDIVRAASTLTLSHSDRPPAIFATHEGAQAMTKALASYGMKFRATADQFGKPFTLN